ncbi:MAG: tRNA (adenosine(37)-N6)-dimethylallyltransferase MiaA [Calditrichaeota bacterium]|nr:tRNA (adenosine(37)-N6)-dimethylallyltransferase MiaA [Calditrichota bacterium]
MNESALEITIPVIAGPTATGKTATAVIVAKKLGCEIISADSRQIYRGMEIGTGAPSSEELQRVLHHLVSNIDPDVRLSAGEFARIARKAVLDINSRGKIPLVVGGSGLYIRALIDGLAPIPPADDDLRKSITSRIDERGMDVMIEDLRGIDPDYAEKIGINDRKRLIRALEVFELTGKSFTEWHRDHQVKPWCQPVFFALNRPREELHGMIERRIDGMLENGWLDEIETLKEHYCGFDNLPPAVTEALGYRELIRYLKDEISFEEARDLIIISTRQFAKRQITWFRADKRYQWLEESGDEAVEKWAESIEFTL